MTVKKIYSKKPWTHYHETFCVIYVHIDKPLLKDLMIYAYFGINLARNIMQDWVMVSNAFLDQFQIFDRMRYSLLK